MKRPYNCLFDTPLTDEDHAIISSYIRLNTPLTVKNGKVFANNIWIANCVPDVSADDIKTVRKYMFSTLI